VGFGTVWDVRDRRTLRFRDPALVAARLQALAPAGVVVIGQRTREVVGERATVRPLGTPELKGRSLQTEVFELLEVAEPTVRATRQAG
jgi:class 3 adenylate cyclase